MFKTKLPFAIVTEEQAKSLLLDLHNNGESFHPEDDASTIMWLHCDAPTAEQADLLNKLMDDIYALNSFDPCEFLLSLSTITE